MSAPVAPASVVGRVGPPYCLWTVLSPPDGSHNIKQHLGRTEALRDFPVFVPAGVGFTSGKWYHELLIETGNNYQQLGYLVLGSYKGTTGKSNGLGDDKASWGFDGTHKRLLSATKELKGDAYAFGKGDVVGFALDADAHTLQINVNGKDIPIINLTEGSDYKPGDVLVPGASLNDRQAVTWVVTKDRFKHCPAGFEAIQPTPYPSLWTEVATDLPEAGKESAIESANWEQLLASYQPTTKTAGADKVIETFSKLRGGVWEYGLKYHADGVESKLEKFSKPGAVFDGTLPNLQFNRAFARDVDAANEEFGKIRSVRRQLVQWTAMFLSVYGQEEAAKVVIDQLKASQAQFQKHFDEAEGKRRYIAAIEDRKTNKCCEYGVNHFLSGTVSMFEKDRSKMKANELEAFVAELTKRIDTLKTWKTWFVEQVGDLPFHVEKVKELDALFAKFDGLFDPAAMEKEGKDKALGQFDKDLDELIRRARSDFKSAEAEFERFPERAEQKYKELNDQVKDLKAQYEKAATEWKSQGKTEAPLAAIQTLKVAALVTSAKFLSYQGELATNTGTWQAKENLRRLTRSAQDEIREINGALHRAGELVYHNQIEEAMEKIQFAADKVTDLKKQPSFLSLDLVPAFFSEYEKKKYELETKIQAWQLDRATSEATRECWSKMDMVLYYFDHYQNEQALEEHAKVTDLLADLELQAKGAWRDVEKVIKTVTETKERSAKFVRDYKDRVVSKQVTDKIHECSTEMSNAKHDLDHSCFETCLEHLQKAKELTEELKADKMLSGMPKAAEWMAKFAEDYPAIQRKLDATMLERAVTASLRVAKDKYDEVEQHFTHYRFEFALTSLQGYKDLIKDLEKDTRFRGHPGVEDYLRLADQQVPDFEKKYRETMVQREFDEAKRVTNGYFGMAEDMFNHSRFEESLVEIQKYKEAVVAIQKREEFGSGGGVQPDGSRDKFVEEALKTKIPEWQEKYKNTVLQRKADKLARELSDILSNAKQNLYHHRDEMFLASVEEARSKAKEADPATASDGDEDSDSRLMLSLPTVKEALAKTFQSIFEMTRDFDIQQEEHKCKEMLRVTEGLLSEANDMLNHSRFEDALTSYAKARDALAELIAAPLASSPTSGAKVQSFVADFQKRAQQFQQQYDSTMHSRRLNDAERVIHDTLSGAKHMFEHYRNDESLVEIRKVKDLIENFRGEFTSASEAAKVTPWEATIAQLEKDYSERVLTTAAQEGIARVKAEFTFAEDHFNHSRWEYCLDSFAKAKIAAAELAMDTRFKAMANVISFCNEMDGRIKVFSVTFDAKMLEREAAEKARGLKLTLGMMEDHFSHYRNEAALESFSTASDQLQALKDESRFSTMGDIKSLVTDADSRLAALKKNYQERELSKKYKESTDAANAKLKECADLLDHSRFDESLGAFHAARELAGELGGNTLFFGMAQLDAFLQDFAGRSEALRVKHAATTAQRAQDNAQREVSGAMNMAKDHFSHHRNEDSLVALQKAKEVLQAFESEFASVNAAAKSFAASQKEQVVAFEKEYADRVFAQEIQRKTSKANSLLASSKDAFGHHRYEEAIRVLSEANEAASLLAADDRFLNLPAVDTFLKACYASSAELKKAIDSTLKQRASDEFLRQVRGIVEDAMRLYDHHRYEEALTSAHKAQELIDEASEVGQADPRLKEQSAALSSFREKFATEHLTREASTLIAGCKAHLDNAKFLLGHHRQEEALGALQSAIEAATSLGDPATNRFAGVDSVTSFFKDWPTLVRSTRSEIQEKIQAKAAREALEEVKRPLDEATQYLDKNVTESALEKLQVVKDKVAVLKDDRTLSSLPAVKSALADVEPKVVALCTRISETIFAREVDAAIHSIKSSLSNAETFFQRFAYEQSLTALQEAKDQAASTSADERLASSGKWKDFVSKEFQTREATFSKQYAEKVLGDELRTVAASVRPAITKAQIFIERGVQDKAQEQLDEARTAATPLYPTPGSSPSLLTYVEGARAVVSEIRAAQAAFARAFLTEESNKTIANTRKLLTKAAQAEARALDSAAGEVVKAAQEASASLLGCGADQPVAELYVALQPVVDFVTKELVPALTKAGMDVFSAATAGASGGAAGAKKGSGKDDSVDAVFGPRFPFLAAIKKGLPHINIDTSIHPKYITCLKATNMASKAVSGELKTLIQNITNADLKMDSENPTKIFQNEVATYPIESIERCLVNFGKALATLQDDLKDAKDPEPTLKALVDGYESFTAAFKDSVAALKRLDQLHKRARGTKWGYNYVQALDRAGHGVMVFTQCPTSIDSRDLGFVPGHNSLGLGFEDMKLTDLTVFNQIIRLSKQCIDSINEWSKEYNGMFVQKQLYLDNFAKAIIKAKKDHTEHCIRQVQRCWHKKEVRAKYMEGLSKFPLARAEALKRGKAYADFANDYYSDGCKFDLTDPYAESGPTPDEDEKPEWYHEGWEMVTPNNTGAHGLPFGKWADQSTDSSIYTAARKNVAGKIVFSKATIADTADSKELGDKFSLNDAISGNGIFARCFWPRALRNYPLAKSTDGKNSAVYGPEILNGSRHAVQFMLFVKIDGKEIKREDQPLGNFAQFFERGGAATQQGHKGSKYKPGPGATDFWAWNQTCRFAVLASDLHLDRHMSDSWDQCGARFAYEFTKLGSGDHKVEVELRYRVRPTEDNWLAHPDGDNPPRTFPYTVTQLSEPLATGSFILQVGGSKTPRRSVLPLPSTNMADGSNGGRAKLEEVLKAHMGGLKDWGKRKPQTEIPLYIAVQSDFYVSNEQWFKIGVTDRGAPVLQKEPSCYARDFIAVFKRLKSDGWKRDQVGVFQLTAYGVEERNPRRELPPIQGIGVAMGGSYTFDLELLSEADAKLA